MVAPCESSESENGVSSSRKRKNRKRKSKASSQSRLSSINAYNRLQAQKGATEKRARAALDGSAALPIEVLYSYFLLACSNSCSQIKSDSESDYVQVETPLDVRPIEVRLFSVLSTLSNDHSQIKSDSESDYVLVVTTDSSVHSDANFSDDGKAAEGKKPAKRGPRKVRASIIVIINLTLCADQRRQAC